MSAAAPAPAVPVPVRRNVPKGFVRTPHSWFLQLPKQCTYTEYVCLGVVLAATIGWQRNTAVLSTKQFMDAANVSRRAVEMACTYSEFLCFR